MGTYFLKEVRTFREGLEGQRRRMKSCEEDFFFKSVTYAIAVPMLDP